MRSAKRKLASLGQLDSEPRGETSCHAGEAEVSNQASAEDHGERGKAGSDLEEGDGDGVEGGGSGEEFAFGSDFTQDRAGFMEAAHGEAGG